MSNIEGELYGHHRDGGDKRATSSITTYPILPLTTRSNPYFSKVFEDMLVVQHPPSHHPPQSAVHSSSNVPLVRRQYNVTGVLSSSHDLFNHITLPLVVGLEEASPLSPSASCLLIASPDCSRPSSPSCNEALSTHQNMIASVLHAILIEPFEAQVYDRPVIHCAVFTAGGNASPRSAAAGSALYDLLLEQPPTGRQQQHEASGTTDPERLLEVRISTIEEAQDFCSEAAMLLTARYKHQVGGGNNLTKRYESPVFNLAPKNQQPSINSKPDPLDRHSSALFLRLRIGSDGTSPSEGIEKEFLLGDLGSHRDVLECALLSLRQQQQQGNSSSNTTLTIPPKVALSSVLLKHTTSSLRGSQKHSHTTMVVAVPSFTTPNSEGLRGTTASLQFLHNVLFDTSLPLVSSNASNVSQTNTTTSRRDPEPPVQQQKQPRSGGLRDQLLSELNPHVSTSAQHDGPSNFSMYQNGGGAAAVPGTILGGSATYHPPSRRSTTRSPSEALPSPTFDNFAPTTTPTKPTINHQQQQHSSNTSRNVNGLVGTPVSSSTARRPYTTGGGGVSKESIYYGNDVSTTSTAANNTSRNVHGTTTTPIRKASVQPPSSVASHSKAPPSSVYSSTSHKQQQHQTSIADLQSQQQEHQSEINRLNSQLVHSVTDNDSLRIDYLDLKRELVNTKEALVDALGELQDARRQNEQQRLQLQLHRGLQPEEENIIEMGDVSSISSSAEGEEVDYDEDTVEEEDIIMPPHQPVTIASSTLGPKTKKSHRHKEGRRSSTASNNITRRGGGITLTQPNTNGNVNAVVNKELEGVVKSLYGRIADMETTYDSDLDIMHALRRENHALSSQNDIMKQRSAELEAEINKLKKAETARLRQKALERIYPGPAAVKGGAAANGKPGAGGRAASASAAKQREDSKSRSPQHPSSNASEVDVGSTPTSAQLKAGLVSAQAAELTSMRKRVAALENQNADLRRSVSVSKGGPSQEGSEVGGGGGDSRSISYAMSAEPQPFDLLSLEKEVQAQVTTVLDQHLREKENEISELRDLLSRNPRVSRGTDRFCCASDSMVNGLRALNIQLDVIDRRRRTELLAEFEEAAGPLSRDPEDAQRRKDLISKMKKDKVLLCVLQQRDAISHLQTQLTDNIASTTPHDVPEIIPTTASGADVETLEKNVVWELSRVSTLKDLISTFRDTCAALDQLKTIA